MMNFFLRRVIGGETGKRESAWFTFLLWLAATVWIGYVEFTGQAELISVLEMWKIATPFVFLWMAAAHGFQWVSSQTNWGGPATGPRTFTVSRNDPMQPDLFDPLPTYGRAG